MLPLCRQHDSLLLIIDVQERLSSAMRKKPFKRLKTNAKKLIKSATELDVPIFHTEQYPKGLGATVKSLNKRLTAPQHYSEKTTFSCCGESSFQTAVQKTHKRQIIICGMESHVCVLQTAMELQAQHYEVYVVEDAITARHKQCHRNAIERMRQQGIIITNTESVLFEWLRDAKHPSFKTVSGLLK